MAKSVLQKEILKFYREMIKFAHSKEGVPDILIH
jgi:hypothetical protein